MRQNLSHFSSKPKNIFLLDSFGALLTSLLLYFILRHFNAFFGLSKNIFEYLSITAFIFFVYSFSCFFFVRQNEKLFLKIICTANILYCLLTFGIVLHNHKTISVYGIVCFLAEIAVIIGLAVLEMKIIKSKS